MLLLIHYFYAFAYIYLNMEFYIKYNIIQIPKDYKSGVRDDPNINVYKDMSTGAFLLDKIKQQQYEKRAVILEQ